MEAVARAPRRTAIHGGGLSEESLTGSRIGRTMFKFMVPKGFANKEGHAGINSIVAL